MSDTPTVAAKEEAARGRSGGDEIAIEVRDLSKTFRIPQERHTTIKQAAMNIFRSKSYQVFDALVDVDFRIAKGEFFGIIGKNGSGKSTLLKILAGIYMPDKGEIRVNGKLSPFLELGVGFDPELTARENVYLGGAVLGMSRKDIDMNFDAIIDFAELREFADMKFKNFSSGMQVRLAFALSIHAHAEILLMDEVLAVGDNNFQAKCLTEFLKYKQEGKTVVLVSHDTTTIKRYCDRAMLLRSGEVVMIDKSDEVVNEYIRYNMADEERKSAEEREKAQQAGGGGAPPEGKKIAISKVDLLDGEGESKNVFETGKPFTIEVTLDFSEEVDLFHVGIGIHREEGGYVFGCNTQMDEYQLDRSSDKVRLVIDKLPLLKGNYYLNVVCFGTAEFSRFDYAPNCRTIKVYASGVKGNYRGVCDVEHQWLNQ